MSLTKDFDSANLPLNKDSLLYLNDPDNESPTGYSDKKLTLSALAEAIKAPKVWGIEATGTANPPELSPPIVDVPMPLQQVITATTVSVGYDDIAPAYGAAHVLNLQANQKRWMLVRHQALPVAVQASSLVMAAGVGNTLLEGSVVGALPDGTLVNPITEAVVGSMTAGSWALVEVDTTETPAVRIITDVDTYTISTDQWAGQALTIGALGVTAENESESGDVILQVSFDAADLGSLAPSEDFVPFSVIEADLPANAKPGDVLIVDGAGEYLGRPLLDQEVLLYLRSEGAGTERLLALSNSSASDVAGVLTVRVPEDFPTVPAAITHLDKTRGRRKGAVVISNLTHTLTHNDIVEYANKDLSWLSVTPEDPSAAIDVDLSGASNAYYALWSFTSCRIGTLEGSYTLIDGAATHAPLHTHNCVVNQFGGLSGSSFSPLAFIGWGRGCILNLRGTIAMVSQTGGHIDGAGTPTLKNLDTYLGGFETDSPEVVIEGGIAVLEKTGEQHTALMVTGSTSLFVQPREGSISIDIPSSAYHPRGVNLLISIAPLWDGSVVLCPPPSISRGAIRVQHKLANLSLNLGNNVYWDQAEGQPLLEVHGGVANIAGTAPIADDSVGTSDNVVVTHAGSHVRWLLGIPDHAEDFAVEDAAPLTPNAMAPSGTILVAPMYVAE